MGPAHSTTLDTPKMKLYYERRKFILLGLTFFFVIAAYTLVQALKDSIFSHIVGKYYINYARFASMCMLMPAIVIYSKLVDRMRRYYLLCFYAGLYAIMALTLAYFLADPLIGIANTQESPTRIFGWLFYFFSEGFSPFVVSVFWAFVNSVSSPDNAKNRYGNIAASSKIGGMMSAGLCWLLFAWRDASGQNVLSDVASHQLALFMAAIFLAMIPVVILYLMKIVPGRFLHGYEAAYKVEKIKKKTGQSDTGIFAGVRMLIKYPYVLGIFGMVFFYELLSVVISYLRIGVAQANAQNLSDVSASLFQMMFLTHFTGFLISFFGTRKLLKKLGERVCLLIIPGSIGLVLTIFMFNTASSIVIVFTFVVLKAINYAFSWPVREGLYIPTVKEIKFKSKSWIDAFGSKFAKSSGASFNLFAEWLGPALFIPAHAIFFVMSIGLWFATAWLLGKRFSKAVKNNEVIGLDKPLLKTAQTKEASLAQS
ncbi:MAG: Npt1/Npt2 family nucleotide transporter [Candidatus Dependentiae bacterium]